MSLRITCDVDLDDVLYECGNYEEDTIIDWVKNRGFIVLEEGRKDPVTTAITAQLPAQTFIELLCTKWGISYLTPKAEILELFKTKILEL